MIAVEPNDNVALRSLMLCDRISTATDSYVSTLYLLIHEEVIESLATQWLSGRQPAQSPCLQPQVFLRDETQNCGAQFLRDSCYCDFPLEHAAHGYHCCVAQENLVPSASTLPWANPRTWVIYIPFAGQLRAVTI